ncbi:MAG: leucyl/phenylalanyl-tRNA--protein transferase, partial [Myxococcota bacterium]|nr:leucyl/phenylalanyl-tRNA--protein transferase [Myxococcota bacterium]
GDEIYWYAPDPRAILPLDGFHTSRRLRQRVRAEEFEIRYSTCFERVMEECAAPRDSEPTTWISSGLIDAYVDLHKLGLAHTVEAWKEDRLVGGLYGVSIGGLFAGESMFSREPNSSKVCLVHLVERMKERGMTLLDIQFMTEHLRRFGAVEIPREEYEERVRQAIALECRFL